jgi:transcriptional regulator with XRE-family HTH domain
VSLESQSPLKEEKSVTNDAPATGPHHVDLHVGALIRARRKALGISQSELADWLGLTFQQVQKYERGSNRVSSSKLYEIALKLDTPLASFFEGLEASDNTGSIAGGLTGFLNQRGAHELVAAFTAMSPALRRQLVSLAEAMAGDDA